MGDMAYEIPRNRQYNVCQRTFTSMFYKFFGKKTGLGMSITEQLAEELHKPVIKKFKRKKVYARFKDNIWAADLAEIELLSLKIKNVKYLLCVIDFFTKYTWVNL